MLRVALRTGSVVALAVIAWVFFQGSAYDLTPLAERAHHPGYGDWFSR